MTPRVLKSSGRGGKGNSILLFGEGEGAAILKVYRRRRSALREESGELAAWFFHRKRGVSVSRRHSTEMLTLDLWSQHGFDVLRRLDRPLPPDIDPPAIWFEYCPGRLLSEVLQDAAVAWGGKADLLRRLGADFNRRHGLALEKSQPLLVHEKATVKHLFVWGPRLITFDFEGGFGPRFPLIEALAEELAGYLRSIAQFSGPRYPDALAALVEGYGSRDRLARIAAWGLSGVSLYRILKRWQDGMRRSVHGKVEVLRDLQSLVRT